MNGAVTADPGVLTERLELRVSIASPLGEFDYIINASGNQSVSDLLSAAEREIGTGNDLVLWCERNGEVLEGHEELERAGVRWGDRLILVPRPQEPTRIGGNPVAELELTSGPCAGQRWTLGPGEYELGRHPEAAICINDRSLSRKHLKLVVTKTGVAVTDVGSSNGTSLDGKALRADETISVDADDELELGRTMLRIRSLRDPQLSQIPQHGGRVEFNRPPRISPAYAPFAVELEAPPDRRRKVKLPLAASLLPLIAGVVLFLLLKSPVMLAFAALSPLMAISSFVSDRRGGKKAFSRGSRDFHQRLEKAAAELDGALETEMQRRRAATPDAPTLISRVARLDPALWERRPSDADFLHLRVGVADLPAEARVTIADGGDPALRSEAEAKLESRRTIPSVPLSIDFHAHAVIGLAGSRVASAGLARWLVLQIAALHSPGEVVVAAALAERGVAEWGWLKWLPHLRGDRVGLQRSVAIGRAESEQLLVELRDLVAQRKALAARERGAAPPQLVVLVDEDTEVDRSLLSAALQDAPEQNVALLWLGRHARDLPGQAAVIVEAEDAPATATVTYARTGRVFTDVSVEAVDLATVTSTARRLAPVVDKGELARAGDIPTRVGLLELLGLLPVHADGVMRRWQDWRGALAATVGAGADGDLTIDLEAEGPHALIAGTTGSGKSELLRTFVAAAAAAAPPDRLSFLLVDYKGGSAFKPCLTLPHVVDVVSDLDEHLAERVVIALESELTRRERLLAEGGCKDLAELHRRNPDAAPPMLVIAVDEFAKLREEVPEFVDRVVDIAQRGRSLGVHMVLAAQTLRNAFTPEIRANTNLRIALRVADESESQEVIASPLAGRIPSGKKYSGRAFARTGHGELREFQTAYVSGRSQGEETSRLDLRVFALDSRADGSGPNVADSDDDNDLTSLAAAAREAQRRMGLRIPSPPWLPVLPKLLDLERLPEIDRRPGRAAIGLVDLPHRQRQDPLILDLPAVGNVAVFGGGRSGKTTVLTTAALALASSGSPEDVRIYGLDAGGGALSAIEDLPHCGGVVRVSDEERIDRLFRELITRIEESERLGAGRDPAAPLLVLLLDDLTGFAHHFDKPGYGSPFEQLEKIFSGGRAAGVHVILTAARRGALPSGLAAQIGARLALRMPTEEDLLALGLDARRVRGAELPEGRGFTQSSDEFHVAVPVVDGRPMRVAEAAAALSARHHTRAPQLAVLPLEVRRESLPPAPSGQLLLGLEDRTMTPAGVDLTDMHFLVVGPYRSGRSTVLGTLAQSIRETRHGAVAHLLAPRRSPLRELDLWDSVASSASECKEAIAKLLQDLDGQADGAPEMFLFIDDGGELTEAVVLAQLEQLVRRGRDTSLRVIAAVETNSARGVGSPWVRELRKEGHGLLLQPNLLADGEILGARLPRRVAAPLVAGRGYLVSRGVAELVQVAC